MGPWTIRHAGTTIMTTSGPGADGVMADGVMAVRCAATRPTASAAAWPPG